MRTYRKELVIFLAEREYETLDQLAEATNCFEEAYSRVGAPERKDRPHTSERPKTNGWQANYNGRSGMNKQNPPDAKKTTGGDISDAPPRQIVCYTCNKPGHSSCDCRQQPKPLSVGTVTYKRADDCPKDMNTAPDLVNGLQGRVLYDTGSNYPVLVAARHVTVGYHPGHSIGEVCQ